MSDTDGKKPLGLGGSRSGQVKQSFSHGRTKSVVVETKRKRVVVPKPGPPDPGAKPGGPSLGDPSKRPAGISDAEMERRMRALQAAMARGPGRTRLLTVRGGYHGGVLTFATEHSHVNVPIPLAFTDYNDPEAATRAILAEG
jgi:hypothetical protein